MNSNTEVVAERRTRGLATNLLQRLLGGFAPADSERRIRVAETLSLGSKQQLLLVICDGERFLVGAGGGSIGSITPLGKGSSS